MRMKVAAVMMILAVPGVERPQSPCSAPEYRQLDFWIGEWDVLNPKGDTVGRSRIERIEGGCAILENYLTAQGYLGKSIILTGCIIENIDRIGKMIPIRQS